MASAAAVTTARPAAAMAAATMLSAAQPLRSLATGPYELWQGR